MKRKMLIAVAVIWFGSSKLGAQPYSSPDSVTDNDTIQVPKLRTLKEFLHEMGMAESDGKHTVVNRYGMLGKYQFSPRTLRLLGFNVSTKKFLRSPALQDSAMVAYMRENRRILRPYIDKYAGTTYRGVEVTESGILAAAHLAGHGGVWSFFNPKKYKYKTKDANGTTVAMYMRRFAGYHIWL